MWLHGKSIRYSPTSYPNNLNTSHQDENYEQQDMWKATFLDKQVTAYRLESIREIMPTSYNTHPCRQWERTINRPYLAVALNSPVVSVVCPRPFLQNFRPFDWNTARTPWARTVGSESRRGWRRNRQDLPLLVRSQITTTLYPTINTIIDLH